MSPTLKGIGSGVRRRVMECMQGIREAWKPEALQPLFGQQLVQGLRLQRTIDQLA